MDTKVICKAAGMTSALTSLRNVALHTAREASPSQLEGHMTGLSQELLAAFVSLFLLEQGVIFL